MGGFYLKLVQQSFRLSIRGSRKAAKFLGLRGPNFDHSTLSLPFHRRNNLKVAKKVSDIHFTHPFRTYSPKCLYTYTQPVFIMEGFQHFQVFFKKILQKPHCIGILLDLSSCERRLALFETKNSSWQKVRPNLFPVDFISVKNRHILGPFWWAHYSIGVNFFLCKGLPFLYSHMPE